MSNSKYMECKNCGNYFKGNFCNLCGQNIRVSKITLKNFIQELSDSVFQINHGLFYTIKSLFLKPGHTIREYLNGQRKVHFKPIAFVLVLATFYYVITEVFDINNLLDDAMQGANSSREERSDSVEKIPLFNWFSNNFAYGILLLIPFFAIGTYVAFLKRGYAYLEHVVINCYITGEQIIFYAILIIIGVIVGNYDIMVSVAFVISVMYRFWAFIQFFEDSNSFTVALRLLLSYLLFFIVLFTLLSIGVVVVKFL